jgi:two-component system heavy metal sensor histidine kinase CusS
MLLYLLVTLTGLLIFGLMSFGALHYALLQGKKTHLQGREDRLISLLNENRAKGVREPLSDQLRNYALVTHEGNLFHIHNLDGSIFFRLKGSAETGRCLLQTIARSRCLAR